MGFLFSFHSNRFSHVISNFLILCLLNLWNMYPVSLHWTNNVTCAFINHIIIYTRAHNVIEKLYSFPSAQPASEQSLKNRNGKIESKNYVQQVNIQTMEVQGKVSASALQQQHNAWIKLSISNRQSLECKLYFDFLKGIDFHSFPLNGHRHTAAARQTLPSSQPHVISKSVDSCPLNSQQRSAQIPPRNERFEIGVCAQSQSLRVAWLTGLWFNLSVRIDLVKHFHIFTFQFLFFVNFVAFHFFKLNNFALSKIKSLKCLRNLINYLPREIFILCMETSERKTKWNYVNSQSLFNFLPNRGGKKVLINFIISPDGLLCGVLRMDNCHQKWHVPFNFLWFRWLQMEEADGDEGNWLKWVWAVVAGEMGGVLSFVGKRLACCLQR